ncbi:MAG: class E sortase [Actinobacteria bacterium]|nr:class E sortase [Actinomycetota bacterium]
MTIRPVAGAEVIGAALTVAAGAAIVLIAALVAERRRLPSSDAARAPGDEPQAAGVRPGVHRRGTHVALTALAAVLAVAAIVSFSFPWWTDRYTQVRQIQLGRSLQTPAAAQRFRARSLEEGDSVTRLRIPRIGLDVVVVEGTTLSALRAGAGHYPSTPLPCASGNVGIAGHRTTYGRPFNRLDELQPGDRIELVTPVGRCTYTVVRAPFVVAPTDLWVVAPTASPSLTLTTCNPKGSARQRLVVRAERDAAVAP